MIVNNRPKNRGYGHCGGCVQRRRGGFAGLQRYGSNYGSVSPSQGFGAYGNFQGDWEDHCDQLYPSPPELNAQCKQWSICGDPATAIGASCRGLPAGVGNVGTDVLGSIIGLARPAMDSEYEPLNLFRTQMFDPIRFAFLSVISSTFPAALKRGGIFYCSLFTISPQMFIPGIGGFQQALAQATAQGGPDFANTQVTDALIGKAPAFAGFVIDLFLSGGFIGAFVKKALQLHAANMPEGDGKAFMTAISTHYGTFFDAIEKPETWKRAIIYASIGDAVRAANFSPELNSVGDSLYLFADVIADCINGNFSAIPSDIGKNMFDFHGATPPTLKPRAHDMLTEARRAVMAAVTVVSTIKIFGIGDVIAAAAGQVQTAFDQQLAIYTKNPASIPTPPGAIITQPPKPKPPVGSNLVVAPAPPAPAPPPAPGASVAPKKSIWAPIGVGAGTGFVAGGPIGALGGAGVAMIITTLKKGS